MKPRWHGMRDSICPQGHRAALQVVCAQSNVQTLRICTNRTCKKQGAQQVAKFVEDLGLDDLVVERTGCFGKCGNGPNVMLSPLDVVMNHVSTVARMSDLLRSVAKCEVPDSLIKATELRIAGNGMARSGMLNEAAALYTEALNLDPPSGRHLLLSNRSGVLLSLGRTEEAAKDADEAAGLAPAGFRNAFIRQVEAHAALKDYSAASKALDQAVERDPGFAKTPEYGLLRKQLDSVLSSK